MRWNEGLKVVLSVKKTAVEKAGVVMLVSCNANAMVRRERNWSQKVTSVARRARINGEKEQGCERKYFAKEAQQREKSSPKTI